MILEYFVNCYNKLSTNLIWIFFIFFQIILNIQIFRIQIIFKVIFKSH